MTTDRIGFPPKPLPSSTSLSTTLMELGIRSGDQIAVSEVASSESSLVASPPVAPPAPSTPAARLNPIEQTVVAPVKDTRPLSGLSVEVDGGFLVLRVGSPLRCDRILADSLPRRSFQMIIRELFERRGCKWTLTVILNRCLFASVGLVLEQSRKTGVSTYLRSVVADAIKASPETWNEAVLGFAPPFLSPPRR